MCSGHVPERSEFPALLVDTSLDIPNPQIFGQAEGIALVALRPAALANSNDDDFLSSGMRALLEDQSSIPGDGSEEVDQGFGVGFQHLALKLSATGTEDSDGAA
jgi:hypothetical protein